MLLTLPACTLVSATVVTHTYVYRVPRLAPKSVLHSCIARKIFSFACKLLKNLGLWLHVRRMSVYACGYSALKHQVQIELYHICSLVMSFFHVTFTKAELKYQQCFN